MKHEHHYIFDQRIDIENVRAFAEWIGHRPEGNILFGLSSGGGILSAGTYLLRILNDNQERITLQILGGAYSTAFLVAYNYQGPVSLVFNESKGMFHYGLQSLNIDERGQVVYKEDRVCLENLKLQRQHSERFVEKFMTPVEQRKFKKGEDVFFNYKRMSEIFPNASIF
jgi:ATP-dependent protease ClpP protease subunit